MTLNQLLKQNQSFYGASVIAGEDCLDREVKSVMVLEAADIENWGKPGQLLLTSFYALQILDAENSRKFFINMHRVKAWTADLGYSTLHHGLLQLLPYSADHSSQDYPI